mgnify:CR=1 FL=1
MSIGKIQEKYPLQIHLNIYIEKNNLHSVHNKLFFHQEVQKIYVQYENNFSEKHVMKDYKLILDYIEEKKNDSLLTNVNVISK